MKNRVAYNQIGDVFEVVIAAKRNLPVTAFLFLWLLLWGFATVFTINHAGRSVFILIWLIIWISGGIFAAYVLLWGLFGKEIIRVKFTEHILELKRSILGLGINRKFQIHEITNLRTMENSSMPQRAGRSLDQQNSERSGIVFNYRSEEFSFGRGLEKYQAEELVGRLSPFIR